MRSKRAALDSPRKLHDSLTRNRRVALSRNPHRVAVAEETLRGAKGDSCSVAPLRISLRIDQNVRTPRHHHERVEAGKSRNITTSLNRARMQNVGADLSQKRPKLWQNFRKLVWIRSALNALF